MQTFPAQAFAGFHDLRFSLMGSCEVVFFTWEVKLGIKGVYSVSVVQFKPCEHCLQPPCTYPPCFVLICVLVWSKLELPT